MSGRYEISEIKFGGILLEVVFKSDNLEDIKHELNGIIVLNGLMPGELFKKYTVTDMCTGKQNGEIFNDYF